MTEEEKQKTILELEQEVCGSKLKLIKKPTLQEKLERQSKAKKKRMCEVCGEKLTNGDCSEHPSYIRMHHNYLQRMRKQYE
tara:strand:- start:124 stop:366 length:243 start_codon:yes stop_codon:yes gene_type:complete